MKVYLEESEQPRHERLLELLKDEKGVEIVFERGPASDRIPVKTRGRVLLLRPEEIHWVEAEHNYMRLHTKGGSHLIRETMRALEARLSADRFRRIHRSVIVNVDCIREIQPWYRGDCVVILEDGHKLTASRNYRDRIREWVG